jgi:hypothetical protein
MNDQLLKSILTGLLRYVLIAIFGFLIKAGYVSLDQLETAAPIVAGALIVVGSMVWRKIKTRYQLQAASALPVNSTPEEIKVLAQEKRKDAIGI